MLISEKPEKPVKNIPAKEFKGYTMEELRYRKALVALRKELCKSNVSQSISKIRKPGGSKITKALPFMGEALSRVPFVKKSGSKALYAVRALIGSPKPIDYILLGCSLIGPVRRITRIFRKKK